MKNGARVLIDGPIPKQETLERALAALQREFERAGDLNGNLGTALSTLGQRESGTARLEEAVAAYRAA
jgi:hypothetical protein